MVLLKKHRRLLHKIKNLRKNIEVFSWQEKQKRVVSMSELKEYINEQLKDPDFKKEWDDLDPEMEVIRAMIKARNSQNLTQKELAEKTGINQANISKLENGNMNPSLKLLKRLADGMGMNLRIEFIPKNSKAI